MDSVEGREGGSEFHQMHPYSLNSDPEFKSLGLFAYPFMLHGRSTTHLPQTSVESFMPVESNILKIVRRHMVIYSGQIDGLRWGKIKDLG